ncbi:hypothetical protein L2E82_02347 [Cichorium intybus]|uniref:Uncharacterized protein n=1 Tax=Cichorium intybus TaxID=13427 RepID=A0ACB9H121_CICIN|nr:hypothetical protein L2E82_02347 [Cichorium intybus]
MGKETVNILRTEGQEKVGGTFVCVCGAIFMVMFKGPVIFGYSENNLSHNEISAKGQPKPAGWLLSIFIGVRFDNWHLSVLCLIGNCICMAVFLAIQASVLASCGSFSLVLRLQALSPSTFSL